MPDELLAGDELPTFKFELEKSEGKVIGGSYGKEATVKQLPISKGIAGVSMRLEPGAMRELHWHATAAEWAFVIEGRVRTTVIDPQGNSETNDFEPGDIWYFPRGHGHMLQCLGDEPCHFILIFDNGYFSEFGTFSITDWIGHIAQGAPGEELRPARVGLRRLPQGGGLLRPRPGPARGDRRRNLQGALQSPPETHKFRMLAQEPHSIHKGGREWRVGSDRFPISKTITGVILDLEPGGLRELHWHPNADEWQYVIEGKVSVTLFGSHGRYRIETLDKGDVGYIPQGYGHSIENVGDKAVPDPDRLQHRPLRGDRPLAVDRRQPGSTCSRRTSASRKPLFEKFPKERVFIAPPGGPMGGQKDIH